MALRRAVVEVEILYDSDIEDPIEGSDCDLQALHNAITDGHCSGQISVKHTEECSPRRMRALLMEQASDPDFLLADVKIEELMRPLPSVHRFLANEQSQWESQPDNFEREPTLIDAFGSLEQYTPYEWMKTYEVDKDFSLNHLKKLMADHGELMRVSELLQMEQRMRRGSGCRKCASLLRESQGEKWCPDPTCEYSDWPQDVEFDQEGMCVDPKDRDRKRKPKEG